MIVARVIEGGLFTTVQDLGRVGYQRYGVPASGAMDRGACLAANSLAGNPLDAALLEMTLIGPRLEFAAPATIALAGADLGAHLDDQPLDRWRSATVLPGQTLWFMGPQDGTRAYLAVLGGIDVPLVLGSRSTYARARLGGIDGRPLADGDLIAIAGDEAQILAGVRRLAPADWPVYGHDHEVRVIRGPQDDRFTPAGIETFLTSIYTVTTGADRMGYRLDGPAIAHERGADIVSDGSPLGGVQVAGDGKPIVLMVDRGTAGGYAKIATAITVDTWRLAQAAPGDRVRFREVSVADAHAALRDRVAWLERIAADDEAMDASSHAARLAGTTADPASAASDLARAAARRRRKATAAVAAVARILSER